MQKRENRSNQPARFSSQSMLERRASTHQISDLTVVIFLNPGFDILMLLSASEIAKNVADT